MAPKPHCWCYWLNWIILLIPPFFFQIVVIQYALDTTYFLKETGKYILEFYEQRAYVPVLWLEPSFLSNGDRIVLADLTSGELAELLGFSRGFVVYEFCFQKETSFLDRTAIPLEGEMFFKGAKAITVMVPIGPQYDDAHITLSDPTGRGITVGEKQMCIDLPTPMLNLQQGSLKIDYSPQHLFHTEIFEQLNKSDKLVEHRSDAQKGKYYLGAGTDRIVMFIRPKHLFLWHVVLYGILLFAWMKFWHAIRTELHRSKTVGIK